MPFEVPESWRWVNLLNVCHIFGRIGFRGYTKEDLIAYDGAITLSPSNIIDGKMDYNTCTYISWNKYDESPEIQIQDNDILLVKTGSSYGKCALVEKLPKQATINPQFVVLKHISCNPEYLTYVLQSKYAQHNYEKFVLGTAIPTFTQVALGNMQIPIPPLSEQNRIVTEIKRLLAIVESLENNQRHLKEVLALSKSKILEIALSGKLIPQNSNDEPAIELLTKINPAYKSCDNRHYENVPKGWCFAKIKDIFIINPKNKANDYDMAGFVSMSMINEGYVDSYQYETREWSSIKAGFTHFQDGDIAVAKISPCLENRKSMILKGLPNGIGAGTTELHVFRSSIVDARYALYFFKSDYFIAQCIGTFNGVVGQQRVGKSVIEDIVFPLPPLEEQRRIACTISVIFKHLDNILSEL